MCVSYIWQTCYLSEASCKCILTGGSYKKRGRVNMQTLTHSGPLMTWMLKMSVTHIYYISADLIILWSWLFGYMKMHPRMQILRFQYVFYKIKWKMMTHVETCHPKGSGFLYWSFLSDYKCDEITYSNNSLKLKKLQKIKTRK